MSSVGRLHTNLVFSHRIHRLCGILETLLPSQGSVLDIGCGDGRIASRLMALRPGLDIRGADVLVRPETHIPVTRFDGITLPFSDRSFDAALLVDVLHHADDPSAVLREAARVTGGNVVIKDHFLEGVLARPTLRFMDWVGNAHHGVAVPGNYWSRREWEAAQRDAGLRIERLMTRLGLYPWPASLIFERSLHFAAHLCPA